MPPGIKARGRGRGRGTDFSPPKVGGAANGDVQVLCSVLSCGGMV